MRSQKYFLTTPHIAGKENTEADAESRKTRRELEWSLDQTIYERGIRRLHLNPTIDLFASRLSYKIKPFISYQPDPEAKMVCAFTVSWQPYLFYVFPSFRIISLVLEKIQREQSAGVIVVPKWPTQPWWPVLMRMVVQNPLILPQINQTLLLPTNPDLMHPLHQRLTLLMCHLSENLLRIKDIQTKLCSSSCPRGETALKSNTRRTSVSGNTTVLSTLLLCNILKFKKIVLALLVLIKIPHRIYPV